MSNPILYQEKLLKPAVLQLEKGVDQKDEVLRVLSLRALGNMALGAPKKVLRPPLNPGAQGAGPSGLSISAGMLWSSRASTLELKAPCPHPPGEAIPKAAPGKVPVLPEGPWRHQRAL